MTTKPERRWPLWPWLVLTLAGVGITAVAAIVGTMATTGADDGGDAVAVTVTVTAVEIQTSTVTETVAPATPLAPATEFADGLFEVGVDVLPGTYRTEGPDGTNPTGCYWNHLAPNGDVEDNRMLEGPGAVTVEAGDRVDSDGCHPWRHQG